MTKRHFLVCVETEEASAALLPRLVEALGKVELLEPPPPSTTRLQPKPRISVELWGKQ